MTFVLNFGVATKNKAAHMWVICSDFYFSMLLDLGRNSYLWDRHELLCIKEYFFLRNLLGEPDGKCF